MNDYDDSDFDLHDARTIEDIPDEIYYRLLDTYDMRELESYLKRDSDLASMEISEFVHLYRIDTYGLTTDEMDSGDED